MTFHRKQIETAPVPDEEDQPPRVRSPRRGQRGVRTKLTPMVQDRILQALRAGAYRGTACAFAGISKTAFGNWILWGEEGRKPYADFAQAVAKAEADFIVASTTSIRLASKTQWQAAAWLLERKYPEMYGQRQRMPLLPEGETAPVPFVMVVPGQVSATDWAADPMGLLPSPSRKPAPDPLRSHAVDIDPDDEAQLEFPEEAPGPDGDDQAEPEHVDPGDVEPDYGDEE